LHHLFEAQARHTPERPALRFEGRGLTYAELDRRSSALAQHLRALGAGPEVMVGLLSERSLDMVVGILAVLKAGAAYVPMDPAYPEERLAFMHEDANLRLVLTQSALVDKLPRSARSVCLDAFHWNAPLAAARGGAEAGAHNLAYVIYTSGSTGRPKGVCIEHHSIVSYVRGVVERLRLEPGMSFATVSTIAADLGHTVIFPALATGGCLHVIAQERAESPARLAEYFAREPIDVLKIVPSHLAALQSASDPAGVMPARRLILGGEASRLEWIERLRAFSPDCEIYNHYGPTEATVGVLTYQVGASLPRTPSATLPLGRPLPGGRIHLLDEQGRPVPPGEKGELCIAGDGVARGYLNRPELTAAKFVADPFSGDRAARMYRTGDVARCLPEGDFEFCGRIDHQIKLHGYRVELGEIEAALREQGAEQAVVLAREDGAGGKQLIAYVTPSQPDLPTTLRERLRERLPQYMVPAAFVPLDKLPLTPNGKVDREALAALPVANLQPAREIVAPRNKTEEALCVLWARLLNVDAVSIHDDVFDLGAHSLMAMKALTLIREAFDVNLSLRNLFEQPTIAGLAEAIDGLSWLARAGMAGESAGDREELVL
jgi:amino acid adenylation domain-containing protein